MINRKRGDRLVIREERNSTDDAWVWNFPERLGFWDMETYQSNCFVTVRQGKITNDGLTKESAFEQAGAIGCF